ncbi:beta-lactamase family protein [Paenibacillus glycanilyticus]|uniref:serine hydrolase domain-containing protein n=1 Tax=Paenibacillus glycanilyticus TaxID=126569 RepID=UPI002041E26B|nr:serine hydrolase domain-containing protein [Paenibacillus glycanilyticus]MCM3625770.1 beta-lactamase family protein [Paenibacillus glycanilyticus]
MDQQMVDKLEAYIEGQVGVDGFNGTVLVSQSGRCLLSKGWGFANREHLALNHSETKFRIGSISKLFTAAGILLLQEQGKLSVNDKLNRFISDYPNGDKITIHHLLTHTSGIPNFTNFIEYRSISRLFSPPESTLTQFKTLPLDFDPGDRFFYSNSGYILLARIVELISEANFSDFLDNSIFKPLEMHNTGNDCYDTVLPHRASGYKVWGDYVHADFIDMSIMTGAGGLYSTVEDLFLWDKAFYSGAILSESSRKSMMTPHVLVNGTTSYGYGLNISNNVLFKNSLQTHKMIGLSGGIDGFMCEYQRFINDDLMIVVMSNVHPSQPAVILNDLARIVLGEYVPIVQKPQFISVDYTLYPIYSGRYSTSNKKFNPVITVEGGNLYISYEPWYKYELKPIKQLGNDRTSLFRTVGAAGELTFFHDEFGRVSKGEFNLFEKVINLLPD